MSATPIRRGVVLAALFALLVPALAHAAFPITGLPQSVEVTSIATPGDGSAIAVGRFSGTLTLGAGTPEQTSVSAQGTDVFAAKFDANGRFLWILTGGGGDDDGATDVVVASNGTIYLAGNFFGTAIFGNLFVSSSTPSESTYFVASIDPAAPEWKWVKSARHRQYLQEMKYLGTSADWGAVWKDSRSEATSIALDVAGNVYVGGAFTGALKATSSSSDARSSEKFSVDPDMPGGLLFADFERYTIYPGLLAEANILFGGACDLERAWTRVKGKPLNGFDSAYNLSGDNDHFDLRYCAENGFVAKYDPNGSLQWMKGTHDSGLDRKEAIRNNISYLERQEAWGSDRVRDLQIAGGSVFAAVTYSPADNVSYTGGSPPVQRQAVDVNAATGFTTDPIPGLRLFTIRTLPIGNTRNLAADNSSTLRNIHVAKLSVGDNDEDQTGSSQEWAWVVDITAAGDQQVAGLASRSDGSVLIAGTNDSGGPNNTGTAFVKRIRSMGPLAGEQVWTARIKNDPVTSDCPGVEIQPATIGGIAPAHDDGGYVTGTAPLQAELTTDGLPDSVKAITTAAPKCRISFLARIAENGVWMDEPDVTDKLSPALFTPAYMSLGAIASDGRGTVLAAGSGGTEPDVVDAHVLDVGGPASGVFIGNADLTGQWIGSQTWTVGTEVARPAGTVPNARPEIEIEGMAAADAEAFFYFSEYTHELYAVRPTLDEMGVSLWRDANRNPVDPPAITIRWPLAGAPITAPIPPKVVRVGQTQLPAQVISVVQGAPIILSAVRVLFSDAGATLESTAGGQVLSIGSTGISVVLRLAGDGTTELDSTPVFYVRLSTPRNTTSINTNCTVGVPISVPSDPTIHFDPGRTGLVLNLKQEFDASGNLVRPVAPVDVEPGAYDGVQRRGAIVPVNAGDVDIAWYVRDSQTGIAEPMTSERFQCSWPGSAIQMLGSIQLLSKSFRIDATPTGLVGTYDASLPTEAPFSPSPFTPVAAPTTGMSLTVEPQGSGLLAPALRPLAGGPPIDALFIGVNRMTWTKATRSLAIRFTDQSSRSYVLDANTFQLRLAYPESLGQTRSVLLSSSELTPGNPNFVAASLSIEVHPPRIDVASQIGSEGLAQAPLDPSLFAAPRVYHQLDPLLPGFNPNDEHALLAPSNLCQRIAARARAETPTGGTVVLDPPCAGGSARPPALFALAAPDELDGRAIEPFAVLKYVDPGSGAWRYRVYRVMAGNDAFRVPALAGQRLEPPYPLGQLPPCQETDVASGRESFFQDWTGRAWARAAGEIRVNYFYPLQNDFYHPSLASGACVPLLDDPTPRAFVYDAQWPANPPVLGIGESLYGSKNGLPEIRLQAAVAIAFDEESPDLDRTDASGLVQLLDPTTERSVPLSALPTRIETRIEDGREVFTDLPPDLRPRVRYDGGPIRRLAFGGTIDESGLGDPLILPNIMTASERDALLALDAVDDSAYDAAVQALYALTRDPRKTRSFLANAGADRVLAGYELVPNQAGTGSSVRARTQLGEGGLLSAGAATGEGYATLVFNDDPSLPGATITMQVIRVECPLFQGQVRVLDTENVFDQRLTLRHSGDFGGDPERFEFDWWIKGDTTGVSPPPPVLDAAGQVVDARGWTQLNNERRISMTIGADPPERSLADNWVFVRYSPTGSTPDVCGVPSPFAGSPAGSANRPEAQLAEGWLKRVTFGLNAFDQRVADFRDAAVNTLVSLIGQAGTRFEGPIALNPSPENLNSVGLIQAYETALMRAGDLTLHNVANPVIGNGSVNTALLLAAGRIADLYTLLGNEAFSDAQDPTIGFSTTNSAFGARASSLFAFQNQLDSLLDEELALLRGRDDTLSGVRGRPLYNRLIWNFTSSDGQVAYVQNYGIRDQAINGVRDGFIDEEDARVLYPQGHGDAWGHYLTAIMSYYRLLRDDNYDWEPRSEAVSVAGTGVPVDYLDERKFAALAAARARTGAQIVDLTYRREYVEDPAGQWQGYKDTRPERAWGVDEWARRAGKGAYYDWLTANALLPARDPDPNHDGIQRVDRTTVAEIGELASGYQSVQTQVDQADLGLNPLGLAKGVVAFDIDPSQVDAGKTHFEQIFERAIDALLNAVRVFDHASEASNRLRENQDSADDFARNVDQGERDFTNRLIELFGTPFPDDIGPGRTYKAGYEGPDLYHYMIVDRSPLDGRSERPALRSTMALFDAIDASDLGVITPDDADGLADGFQVEFEVNVEDFRIDKPAGWIGRRKAPGELQNSLSDAYLAEHRYEQSLREYDNKLAEIEQVQAEAEGDLEFLTLQLGIQKRKSAEFQGLNAAIQAAKIVQTGLRRTAAFIDASFEDSAKCVYQAGGNIETITNAFGPAVGMSVPTTAALSCAISEAGNKSSFTLETLADGASIAENSFELAKDSLADTADLEIAQANFDLTVIPSVERLKILVREEVGLRANVYAQQALVQRALDTYAMTLARAQRVLAERKSFRTATAGDVAEQRYNDATFRIFRNEALQKYKASFDLASRYAYLAATAYDYETNLLGGSAGSGENFLAQIVKERQLGEVDFLRREPQSGSRGLSDAMARLSENFKVLKGRLGFNNPQTETNRFSLRRELLLRGDATSDADWRAALASHYVDNLWENEDFRRYARPFAPLPADPRSDPQPAIVIPFSTTVEAKLNFFGGDLRAGDSAYDATNFSTKVRSVGVWLGDYSCAQLSNTPRVYLIPTGADVLRPPTAGNFATREWTVVDQALPVPFEVGAAELFDPNWIPSADSLSEPFGAIRRFSSFRAYEDGGQFVAAQTTTDSRLIGRSVWNTNWLLVIPGQTLLFDPAEGLERFVHGPNVSATGCAAGSGVSDIQLFFQTYAISGN